MPDILDKQIGAEAHVKVAFSKGKISLVGSDEMKGVGVHLGVDVSADYFLDQLAAAIPGQIDDAIIGVLKAALNQLP